MSASSASSACSGSTGSPCSVASIASSAASTSGSSGSALCIAGLPKLAHRAIEERRDTGLAHPEHLGDLPAAQAGPELEGDELPLAGRELAERGAHRRPAQRHLDAVLGTGQLLVGRLGGERRDPPAAAQLVERGIARDPEQPRALLTAAPIEAATPPVGALEGERDDILGGSRIAQQRADVGIEVAT